ncbi:conserved hypothetical protein [Escherichia phage AR1]|uniref:Uncharacterized protein n=1 Tax=Escherichia phage AR1 TaxID=66711 RepID=D4Z9L7_BPAR1|nr:hypothetical protein AR1_071 [Escherichia phage AR1]BAI83079.1 conserved hypothetical protein [Escherichia phage AR1]
MTKLLHMLHTYYSRTNLEKLHPQYHCVSCSGKIWRVLQQFVAII